MIAHLNLNQRTLLALCVALVALPFFTFVYALWQWRNDWVVAHQPSVTPNLIPPDETVEMIARIPHDHLFGLAPAKASDVPVTNLAFRVTGIVKVEDEQAGNTSKAYISISGQPSKIYRPGDNLPYGVKIYAITPNAVILQNAGHLEKLPLPRESLPFKLSNKGEHRG